MTRRSIIRRTLAVLATTGGLLAVSAPAVLAHSEFDLKEVAPGSIVALVLTVENESQTAGTTQVELRFPQPLVIVELPAVDGWTATAVDGTVGAEAIGVLWVRPSASPGEDPSLPLTIGPLPTSEGRMQFKVLQTYGDGTEDAWISDWPVGEPEPDKPGPVLDLVAGAPGTIPESTTTTPAAIADTTPTTQAPVASAPATQPATADTPAPTTVPTSTPRASGRDDGFGVGDNDVVGRRFEHRSDHRNRRHRRRHHRRRIDRATPAGLGDQRRRLMRARSAASV